MILFGDEDEVVKGPDPEEESPEYTEENPGDEADDEDYDEDEDSDDPDELGLENE